MTRKKHGENKYGWFQCKCGCGHWFSASWKTRKPEYLNKTHRQRAYRARARRRVEAWERARELQLPLPEL
jgi:hypothetical protein